jgi:hypothetical protein
MRQDNKSALEGQELKGTGLKGTGLKGTKPANEFS